MMYTDNLIEAHTEQTSLIETLQSTLTEIDASAALTHSKLLASVRGIDVALAEHKIDIMHT